MAKDASLYVRKAIITRLKRTPAVSAIVGQRVHGQAAPAKATWPFVRYGAATVVPLRATCLDGSTISMTVHAFCKGADDTEASTLAAAIADSLDGQSIPLTAPDPARLSNGRWTSTITMRDGAEATGWHAVINLEGRVVS